MKVGIIGLGVMGRVHYNVWKARDDSEVVALCDRVVTPEQFHGGREAGNLEAMTRDVDLGGERYYTRVEEMLEKESLDAVSITVPTFVHAELTEICLRAGVHVLCEKPMALTLEECDRMIEASDASGCVLQIGHCIRFWPEYVVAREMIRREPYGRVLAASFRRAGTRPWSSWFADSERSGGVALDLHIHDADFIAWAFGMPDRVYALQTPGADHIAAVYGCGDVPCSAEGSWLMAPTFGFEMSFRICFERATLLFNEKSADGLRLFPAEGEPTVPVCPEGDGYSREIDYFVATIQGKETERVITPRDARETIRLVQAAVRSAREGRPVDVSSR